MPNTAVLILNWNNLAFLQEFIPVLADQTPKDLADIIVADNGSTDDSLAWLKKEYPFIKTIIFDKNHGFAGGYNLAVAKAEYENLVIMNSDILVGENWLEPLLEKIKDKDIAAVMPKILSYQVRNQFEYAGACGGYIDKYGYPFCRGRIFDEIEPDMGQYNEAVQVHWTTGACMLVKRDAFLKVGGFDAGFFAHMEEIDLCWRLRRMGYQLWVEPSSQVYHVGGGTLPNESANKLYLNFRNNLALIYKNIPRQNRSKVLFIRMILDGIAALKYLLTGKSSFFISILRAHQDFNKWKPLLKKEMLEANFPTGCQYFQYRGSIIYQYFIRKKKRFSDLNYK